MLDAAIDLFSHGQQIYVRLESTTHTDTVPVSSDEAQLLIAEVRSRKRKQMFFFNLERKAKLRISVSGHFPRHGTFLYCVLCG